MFLFSCGTDPLTGEKSPDKSKLIMAYTKRIGSSKTFISIEGKNRKNKKVILILTGNIPVSFKWINNQEVNIFIPKNVKIEEEDSKYEDVKFYKIRS